MGREITKEDDVKITTSPEATRSALRMRLGTDHLIFGGGGAGIFLKKIASFPRGEKKIKCLQ